MLFPNISLDFSSLSFKFWSKFTTACLFCFCMGFIFFSANLPSNLRGCPWDRGDRAQAQRLFWADDFCLARNYVLMYQFLLCFSMWVRSKPIISLFQTNDFSSFTVWDYFFLLYFMNYRLKVLPKMLKCSILVWNYGDDVHVPRSNRRRHLFCWRNAFLLETWGGLSLNAAFFFLRWFLAFYCFKCYLGSFSMYKTAILPNVIPPKQTWRGSSIGSVFAWHASGPGFDPHVRHILSWRLGHKNISTAILPLPLIQEEQLSVTGERMCAKNW